MDVSASFAAGRDPARSPLAADLFDVRSVEIVDPRRLVIVFDGDRPGRAEAIARLPIVPIKRVAAAKPGEPNPPPPGTGPYRIDKTSPERIELARHAAYWGEPAVADRVVYAIAVDRDDAIRRLERGDVDVVFGVSPDQARSVDAARDDVVAFGYAMPANVVAIYGARRPALADPAHRRALTALLDRAAIGRDVLGTGGAPPTSPFPDGDPGIDPGVVAVPFDRALAARLLGDARPVLDVLVPAGSRGMARVADIWASDAGGLATLTPKQVPFADVLSRLREGKFDVALLSMTTGPDLDLWPQLSSHAPADTAWTGVRDRALDELLDKVRAEPDRDKRAALRKQLHRRLSELEPFALIARDRRLGLARGDVGGIDRGNGNGPPPARTLYRGRGR
jgi:ABC-type transport system substrate-binding protein